MRGVLNGELQVLGYIRAAGKRWQQLSRVHDQRPSHLADRSLIGRRLVGVQWTCVAPFPWGCTRCPWNPTPEKRTQHHTSRNRRTTTAPRWLSSIPPSCNSGSSNTSRSTADNTEGCRNGTVVCPAAGPGRPEIVASPASPAFPRERDRLRSGWTHVDWHENEVLRDGEAPPGNQARRGWTTVEVL